MKDKYYCITNTNGEIYHLYSISLTSAIIEFCREFQHYEEEILKIEFIPEKPVDKSEQLD